MTTKLPRPSDVKHPKISRPLELLWKSLRKMGPLLKEEELDDFTMEVYLADCQVLLEEAREAFVGGRARKVAYAVGIEHSPGEFGMLAGPMPELKTMLDFPLDQLLDRHIGAVEPDQVALIRFEGTEANPTETVLYRLRNDYSSWESVE